MKNQLVTMKSFYNIDKIDISNIDNVKFQKIIEQAKKINKMFLNKQLREDKDERYLRIMEIIHGSYRENIPVNNEFATTSQAEKFLLFMFSIDPNFEIAIIYASENRINDVKIKMREKFGVYDPYLIKIEKAVIKKLLSKEQQTIIYEEIEKRAFK